jgi:hypothetical protein
MAAANSVPRVQGKPLNTMPGALLCPCTHTKAKWAIPTGSCLLMDICSLLAHICQSMSHLWHFPCMNGRPFVTFSPVCLHINSGFSGMHPALMPYKLLDCLAGRNTGGVACCNSPRWRDTVRTSGLAAAWGSFARQQ